MRFMIPLEVTAERSILVEESLTAEKIGSGDVCVLATPMMIALMEAAAMEAVQPYLTEGWTTVGTKVDVDHIRATPVGDEVRAQATLVKVDDRSLEFAVTAKDGRGLIGQGLHRRFIVNHENFMAGIKGGV
jgi:fluoroacetyl-CoA thioesterase